MGCDLVGLGLGFQGFGVLGLGDLSFATPSHALPAGGGRGRR